MLAAASSVVFGSLETTLPELQVYSAVLGSLSLLTALLMVLDILTGSRRRKAYRAAAKRALLPAKSTQTDVGQIVYEATRSVDLLGPAHRVSNGHAPVLQDDQPGTKNGSAKGRSSPARENGHVTSGDALHDEDYDRSTSPPPAFSSRSRTQDSILAQLRSSMKGSSRDLEEPTFKKYSPKPTSAQRRREQDISSRSDHPPQLASSGDEADDVTRVPTVSFRERKRPGAVQLLPMTPVDPPRLRPTQRPADPEEEPPRTIVMEIPDELGREIEAAYAVLDKGLARGEREGSKRSLYRTSAYLSLDPADDGGEAHKNGQYAQDMRELEEAVTGRQWQRFGSGRHSPLMGPGKDGALPRDITQEVEAALAERDRQLSGGKRGLLSSSRKPPAGRAELGKRQRTVEFADPPSPDSDSDHWRYDSRDANLSRSSSRLDDRTSPSSPQDPGFVMHTAYNWPDASAKTPVQTPQPSSDENEQGLQGARSPARGRGRSLLVRKDSGPPAVVRLGPPPSHDDLEEDDVPGGGSLTAQLLQRWFRQKQRVAKTKSGP
ncbi:uncharacterized protein LOC134538100 isoform X2 [Bacillus rossius redtenbacheri]